LENPEDLGEPPVEVVGVAPTEVIEVEEEDSFVEFLASEKEMKGDQADGTGAVPVPEAAESKREGQSVGTGEPILKIDISGEEPDQIEVDPTVRTGEAPIREVMEETTRVEPVPKEVEQDTRAMPVRETGEGDLHFLDCPRDDFEKVGEFTPEETSQTPPAPVLEQPTETPSSAEPRKKRLKTLAGRTDLPWVRKLAALKAKASSSSQQTPQKQPSQPTRKSYRIAVQGVRSCSANQGTPVIEKFLSSTKGSPVKGPDLAAAPLESPVLESEQASTENSPKKTFASQLILKRKAEAQPSPATKASAKSSAKQAKSGVALSPKPEKFQRRGVVRGKLVKVSYFQEQGLEVFLETLKAQGWYELSTNTQMGCSQPDVAEFYANVILSRDVLTRTVNGVLIEVDAQALGVILGCQQQDLTYMSGRTSPC